MQSRGKIVVSALAASVMALVLGFTGCTSILGDFDVAPAGDAGEGGPGADTGPAAGELGAACTTAAECSGGHCVDGVCCESACDGTCERCGPKGNCVPIAAGNDPDNECKALPVADAGAPDANELDAASFDGGDGGEGGVDIDSGIHLPDSGVTAADTACKGACDGNRKCKYPGKETSCGTKFCNTTEEKGGFVCDNAGHCGLDIEACTAYACTGTDCNTSCAAPTDCLSTHFCNNAGKCQQKLADSISCNNPDQCQSGFCVDGVCCDTACSGIPGAKCNNPGKVGTCQCLVNGSPCNTGASCILAYRDADNDTYGDRAGTVAAGTAKVACSDAIPAGFVADNTDCADNDDRAHPGAGAQGTPINGTTNNYDFNCDGVTTKTTPEYFGSCGFCGTPDATNTCADPAPTCTTANQAAKFACPLSSLFLCNPITRICSRTYSCGGPFVGSNRTGFTTTVNCGAFNTTTTCGTCTAAGLGDQGNTTTANVQQTCR